MAYHFVKLFLSAAIIGAAYQVEKLNESLGELIRQRTRAASFSRVPKNRRGCAHIAD